MKKLLAVSVLVALSCTAVAKQDPVDYYNLDGAKLSDVCVAATKSKIAMKKELNRQKISAYKASKIKCNGVALKKFGEESRNKQPSIG